MNHDELEFAISQYMDGTLSPLERAALEERLAKDAEARGILGEYQRLDGVVKNGLPVPPIAWDRLADEIGKSLESQEAPVRHYRLPAVAWAGRLAIAAAILLLISVAIHFVPNSGKVETNTGIAVVTGPQAERSTAPEVAEISIGPAPSMATRSLAAEEIVARPAVVLIDQAAPNGEDVEQNMY